MKQNTSRRQFLQAGLALPVVGLVSPNSVQLSPTPQGLAFRTLGKTGLKVTSVGCAAGAVPDPDILARALDSGINYYDTARIYGQGKSEQILGKAIKGKRDKIVLASKTYSNTKAKILEDIETTLSTLGTDHLDIYHQHSRHEPKEITDEMIETMELVKKQGKTRFIGVSTHDPNAMVDFILKVGKFYSSTPSRNPTGVLDDLRSNATSRTVRLRLSLSLRLAHPAGSFASHSGWNTRASSAD